MPANEDKVVVAPVRRNPSWSREELILALELYFRVPPSGVTETHPEIVRVSEELQRLSAHADPADATRFRNPNGVHMKMFNFMALDPSQGGRGLANGGRKDKEVWNEYQDDRSRLNQVASAIRSAIDTKGALRELFEASEGEDEDAAEGRVLTRMHRHRERDPAIVRRKKERVLQTSGLCDVKPVTSISTRSTEILETVLSSAITQSRLPSLIQEIVRRYRSWLLFVPTATGCCIDPRDG